MTRFLSESLMATEPHFRLSIRHLEQVHGNPGNDIRLSTAVQTGARAQLQQLGLDPRDTTGHELYQSLLSRAAQDEKLLQRSLQTKAATHVSAEASVMDGLVHVLSDLPLQKDYLALKSSVCKAIIKKLMPKKAMKQLGYRSLDSFLKHESPASVLAAAQLSESEAWQQSLQAALKRLKPQDFEVRPLSVQHLKSSKWQQLAAEAMERNKHTVLAFPVLGAIVLLPLPEQAPVGAVMASVVLSLQSLLEVRTSSTYLKLALTRGDFGAIVQAVSIGQPQIATSLLDRMVPWQMIQHYYTRLEKRFRAELFEPHLELADLHLPTIEELLAVIEPGLKFWQHSTALGVVHDRQPVSLNVIDAALNLCNRLPYEQRIVHYFQQSLWHELMLGYLKHDTIEQSVLAHIQPELALAPALN